MSNPPLPIVSRSSSVQSTRAARVPCINQTASSQISKFTPPRTSTQSPPPTSEQKNAEPTSQGRRVERRRLGRRVRHRRDKPVSETRPPGLHQPLHQFLHQVRSLARLSSVFIDLIVSYAGLDWIGLVVNLRLCP